MSLKQKLKNINVATRNLTIQELADEMQCSRQTAYNSFSPKMVFKLLQYINVFGFDLVLENRRGDRITITEDDITADAVK